MKTMTETLGRTLLRQMHDDVEVVTSGRLLFRPVWTKPAFDDEGAWMLNAQEAGD
jgi:hypothetical protein